ncbi:MAG: AraC family transcriptional regulator [Chloroflexota bacterium]|nr:AraC family transcriptional regulator [Chloroflexota bacterium]
MRVIDTSSPPPQADTIEGSSEPDVVRLAQLLRAYTPYDGRFELRIPGVHAIRASRPYTARVHTMQRPALCLVAQGAKSILLGQEAYAYDASRMLVASVDLPVAAQVTRASPAEPYLAFRLDLDHSKIAALVVKVFPYGVPQVQDKRAMYVARSSPSIVDAATRLLELMAQPGDAELLAPLVIDEILIRLLRSSIGSRVAQLGLAESSVHRIGKAVDWVRAHYAESMNVAALAASVHMSVSSFHQHFKAVTSMSPLQYQKVLRLQEARRLMLSTMMDVGTASRHVGYLSASQFSRDYSRCFGTAPTRDIARLHDQSVPGADVSQ